MQTYYKMLTLNKDNLILQGPFEDFQKLAFAISASKFEKSDTIDFDGFLKIKYYFIDKQATDEELASIKDYDPELFEKYNQGRIVTLNL